MLDPRFSYCNVYLWEPSYTDESSSHEIFLCWIKVSRKDIIFYRQQMHCFSIGAGDHVSGTTQWFVSVSDMDIEDVRDYEKDMQEKTNHKVGAEI